MSVTVSRTREISTFAAVGVAATVTHLVVAWMTHSFGASAQAANLFGWLTALGVSFMGHARMTFRVGGPLASYLPRFVFVSGVAFVVSAAVVAMASGLGAPFALALLAVGLTVPPASYLAQRFVVFRDGAPTTDRLALVSAAVGVSVFVWFRTAPVNHDVAWYLVSGRQWIEGARLYSDLSEVNPPLAFYLIRAALHVGDLFALGPAASLAAFMAILIAVSLSWVGRILPCDAPCRGMVHAVFALALVLPFLGHFGQREHLMVVLIAPWVVAALYVDAPLSGRGAVPRGLLAGVGICLKPYFLVYPMALTIAEAIRTRSLRPIFARGNLAMLCVGVVYLASVAVLHPEYLAVIVPEASLVYGAVTLPLALQIANISPVATALAGMVLLAGRGALRGWRALALFIAALASYVLQGNGFTYHAAPIHAIAIMGLVHLAAIPGGALRLAAAGSVALFLGQAIIEGGYRNPLSAHLAGRLESLDIVPRSLLVWSPSLLPAFPLTLDLDARWTGHAGSLWLLPGTLDLALRADDGLDPRLAVLDRQRLFMERDLAGCPEIVVLDRVMPFSETPLDLRRYAGPTVAGKLDAEYELLERGYRFDILTRMAPCHPG